MSRVALSMQQKRERTLDFFAETTEPFRLADLEKRLSKEKGITSQSVKDVVEGLMADALVCCEKIGSSNYYWSFPSQRLLQRTNALESLRTATAKAEASITQRREAIVGLRSAREDTPERHEALSSLADLEGQSKQLASQLAIFKECDPTLLQAKVDETSKAYQAASQWTDNVFAIQSWLVTQCGKEAKDIQSYFAIPSDLDYPPPPPPQQGGQTG